MGELFTNIHEYVPLIKDRLIDYIRVHMSGAATLSCVVTLASDAIFGCMAQNADGCGSDIGGLTPMRKLATLCEFFGVRTALHGPGDCNPVGMMATLAIDLSVSNFGIQVRAPRPRSDAGNRLIRFLPWCLKTGAQCPATT